MEAGKMGRKKKPLPTKELFIKTYGYFLSEETLKKYLNIIDLLERDKLEVKSKSRYLQVRSVLKKLERIGRNDYGFVLPDTYPKRSDRIKSKTEGKRITEEELSLILSKCPDTFKGRQLHLAIMIAYYGGLRLSEVLSLKNDNIIIDEDNEKIFLDFVGKGDKDRNSILPYDIFIDMLSGFQGFDITVGYVELAYGNIVKKKLKGIISPQHTFHGLRHSFVKRMVEAGLNLNEMIQLTGHKSFDTLKIYLPEEDNRKKLSEKMGY
jgi:integrase